MITPLIILLHILLIAILADFIAGIVHWLEDNYFSADTPLIGPALIRPNIVHHHLPRFFTKLSWWQSSRELIFLSLAILGAAAVFNFLTWQVLFFCFLAINANQVHKWAHQTRKENGKIVSLLQDLRILQTPRQHALHHTDPKNTFYCPLTNMLNPMLEKIQFWPRLEKLIARLWSIQTRVDTSVRGQGPEPQWLTDYRRKAAVAR